MEENAVNMKIDITEQGRMCGYLLMTSFVQLVVMPWLLFTISLLLFPVHVFFASHPEPYGIPYLVGSYLYLVHAWRACALRSPPYDEVLQFSIHCLVKDTAVVSDTEDDSLGSKSLLCPNGQQPPSFPWLTRIDHHNPHSKLLQCKLIPCHETIERPGGKLNSEST